jgi:uncharacterized membrane protein
MKTTHYTTQDLVKMAMLAAVCMIATYIKIPLGNGAMVHLGSAAIFTTGILFGGRYGGFAGAIGSAMYDLIGGFSPYTLWSFVIKGVSGWIVGTLSNSKIGYKKTSLLGEIIRNILSIFVAALFTLAGYLVAWSVVIGSFEAALINIPATLLSSGVGLVVALPLSFALKKPLAKYRPSMMRS